MALSILWTGASSSGCHGWGVLLEIVLSFIVVLVPPLYPNGKVFETEDKSMDILGRSLMNAPY